MLIKCPLIVLGRMMVDKEKTKEYNEKK